MSPSDRAWLYVPGNEQTLRLPVSGRFTNRNDLSSSAFRLRFFKVGCYLHSALEGSMALVECCALTRKTRRRT